MKIVECKNCFSKKSQQKRLCGLENGKKINPWVLLLAFKFVGGKKTHQQIEIAFINNKQHFWEILAKGCSRNNRRNELMRGRNLIIWPYFRLIPRSQTIERVELPIKKLESTSWYHPKFLYQFRLTSWARRYGKTINKKKYFVWGLMPKFMFTCVLLHFSFHRNTLAGVLFFILERTATNHKLNTLKYLRDVLLQHDLSGVQKTRGSKVSVRALTSPGDIWLEIIFIRI